MGEYKQRLPQCWDLSIEASAQGSRFAIDESLSIDLKDVNISVEGRELLVGAHVLLKPCVHYGLLGRNGVGKSILFDCLANGRLLPLHIRKQLKMMIIRQTMELDPRARVDHEAHVHEGESVLDVLRKRPEFLRAHFSDKEEWAILAEQQTRARGKVAREKVLEIERNEVLGGEHGTDDPVTEICGQVDEVSLDLDEPDMSSIVQVAASMSLKKDDLSRPYSSLSGGWRMRVLLAKALLWRPDVLLMDEPTNHLCIAGISWLQKIIKEEFSDMTIVMVSHVRSFLNSVAEEIIWFKNKQLEYYKGNYDTFIQTIEDKAAFAERMQSAIDRKKARMEESLQASKAQALKHKDDKKLKQVASRRQKAEERIGYERNAKGHRFKLNRDRIGYFTTMLADVEHVEQEHSQNVLRFATPEPTLPRFSGPLVIAQNLSFSRASASLSPAQAAGASASDANPFHLSDVNLNVEAGQRLAILGANGQGKTTLLNLLAGELTPCSGSVQIRVPSFGYFKQDVVAELGQEDMAALDRLCSKHPTVKRHELWKHIGSFGLGAPQTAERTSLKNLSGGQRVAYAFAELSLDAPCVILLDEPNSHLDLDALVALEESLEEYPGALVFVSHDISFILRVATHAMWIEGGRAQRIELEDLEEKCLRTTPA
eukprot:751572-Hanusia_phi.AAC.6